MEVITTELMKDRMLQIKRNHRQQKRKDKRNRTPKCTVC